MSKRLATEVKEVVQSEGVIKCRSGAKTILKKIGRETTPENERAVVDALTSYKDKGILLPHYNGVGRPSSKRLLSVESLV